MMRIFLFAALLLSGACAMQLRASKGTIPSVHMTVDGDVDVTVNGQAISYEDGDSDPTTPQTKQPNILFALIDDLGNADLEYTGGDDGIIKTPRMNELLSQGVKVDRAYSYSWCGPSRSSLLSGRMTTRVNVNYTNEIMPIPPDATPYNYMGNGIPGGMTGIGSVFKNVGYKTHYMGKWGAGYMWKEQMPRARGFDTFFGYLQDSLSFWTMTRDRNSVSSPSGCELLGEDFDPPKFQEPYVADYWRTTEDGKIDGPADLEVNKSWCDYAFLDESLKVIADHDVTKPLFLLHSFHSVHTPLDPPDEVIAQYENNPIFKSGNNDGRLAYAGMVSFVDSAIGNMVDALKERGMWENTILVMTSDNGGPIYGGNLKDGTPFEPLFGGANNDPLRGGKTSEFEGGIRVNSFISGGIIPEKMRGKTVEGYVHISDWYTTLGKLAGADVYDKMSDEHPYPCEEGSDEMCQLPQVDGIDQWPMLSGETTECPRKTMHISATCLIDGDWKLISGRDVSNVNKRAAWGQPEDIAIMNYYGRGYSDWSGISDTLNLPVKRCPDGCLWNIRDDPSEAYEMGDKHPEILESMMAKLKELNKEFLFVPYRGVEGINFEPEADYNQCEKIHAAGWVGPYASGIENYKPESANGGIPKGTPPPRGKRGRMMCQAKIDGAANCQGTKFIVDAAGQPANAVGLMRG